MQAIPRQIVQYSATGTDAAFFTNHDTARAAGFLRRDENLIKLAWAMNLLQGGNAFLYYGEELGMSGSGKDENKRAPMYWSAEPAAPGVTVGPAGMETQNNSFPPAMQQITNDNSILQFVRKANQVRAVHPAIARGETEVLNIDNSNGILAITKTWQEQTVVLVYNTTGETIDFNLDEALIAKLNQAGSEASLIDYLSATGATVQQQGSTLSLPPYSISVLDFK